LRYDLLARIDFVLQNVAITLRRDDGGKDNSVISCLMLKSLIASPTGGVRNIGTTCVMLLPLARLSRLIVKGKDRAKYLHNFCTNNIKELPSGKACEAFFCDVKARVIAHGYVLALDDCHEIWMLGGDEPGILKHLNRYIITEDVTIQSATETTSAVAAIGSASSQSLLAAVRATSNLDNPVNASTADSLLKEPLSCIKIASQNGTAVPFAAVAMCLSWADTPMLWFAKPRDSNVVIPTENVSAAESQFEQLRMRERFPIINQDMSIENMAPEAERNAATISYVKGCYLGQEPIARLDAMGHVNRALRCVESKAPAAQIMGTSILTEGDSTIGTVTSAASTDHGSIGLAMLRTNAFEKPLHVIVDGQSVAIGKAAELKS